MTPSNWVTKGYNRAFTSNIVQLKVEVLELKIVNEMKNMI
jgi:hypothetical protein